MNECWDDLKDYSRYQINRNGQIRNIKTKKILKWQYSYQGYVSNTLLGDDDKIHCVRNHILVAKQYIPNPEDKPYVNHLDNNPQNPCVNNLEWVTERENSIYGEKNAKISESNSIPINEYDLEGRYIRTWKSAACFANFYGIRASGVTTKIKKDFGIVAGKIVKIYNGDTNNIPLQRISKISIKKTKCYNGNEQVPQSMLFDIKSEEQIVDEIFKRELASYVPINVTRADLAFLKLYIEKLESKLT